MSADPWMSDPTHPRCKELRREFGEGMNEPSLRESARPWTRADAVKLWRYNWIKRPWENFVWSLPWGFGARFRRERPHLPPGWPRLGKMTRANMEWAYAVAQKHQDGSSPKKGHPQ